MRLSLLLAASLSLPHAILPAQEADFGPATLDPLSAEERAWLAANPLIRLRANENYAPSDFFDAEGRHRGIAADYVSLIQERLGIEFSLVSVEEMRRIRRSEAGDPYALGDLVTLSARTVEREEDWLFTDSYLDFQAVIIVREDRDDAVSIDDLRGLRVGVVDRYALHAHMVEKHPEVDLQPVEDTRSGLQLLSFGVLDAFVSDLPVAVHYLEREGISNLRITGATDFVYKMGFSVRQDWPELLSIVQKGLDLITPEERQAIYREWIHIEPGAWYHSNLLWFGFLGLLLLLAIAVPGFFFWNRSLAARVRMSTGALRSQLMDQQRVEAALRTSEGRLRTIIEDQTEFVVRWLPGGIRTFVNESYCEYSNKSADELIGFSFIPSIPEKDKAKFESLISQLTPENPVAIFEHNFRHHDGSLAWTEWADRALFDETGKVIEYQSVGRDITKQKQAEEDRLQLREQLRQTQKLEALGTLAGGIAHDFNNILSGIIGYADLARCDIPPNNPKLRAHIEQILEAGERASLLVQQINTFSKSKELDSKVIELGPLVEQAIDLVKATTPGSTQIRCHAHAGSYPVECNPTQMHQILLNLLTNAVQAIGGDGGTIDLQLTSSQNSPVELDMPPSLPAGDYVQVTVSDTGQGIESDQLERIFEPFFTTKEVGQGVGMGLAVVHGIISQHGGAITVESERGEGAVFKVFLPLAQHADGVGRSPRECCGKEHILFVDDEQTIASLGRQALESCGYRVESKTSSSEALDLFQEDPNAWDLVITDQRMPKMTGTQLAAEIRRLRPEVPIILCSGYSGGDSPQVAQQAGLQGFLAKPFSKKRLEEMVRGTLDRAASS
ncbi:MAG: ATP-binding protein [Planctomycetota bacterium]|jgi:PAS domain S-box-containing protein